MEYIECKKAGLLTTVQDLGRQKFQQYGISSAGAMDSLSLRIGNIITGNPEHFAGIETTLLGPEFIFHGDGIIAITGADSSPKINGHSIEMWSAIQVTNGDLLSFSIPNNGCRTYISISGGVNVEDIMGSKSTFLRGRYGGFEGRAIISKDFIKVGPPVINPMKLKGRKLPIHHIPSYFKNNIRFIWGPQENRFTDSSRDDFIKNAYEVTNQSDRMGYRLDGTKLFHKNNADILSDYIAPGAIQVPSNGQPIVLMADCQMSGGYTKIGMIIGVDLPLMAQKKPGDSIQFEPITIEKAQSLWAKQEKWLYLLKMSNHN